MGLDPGGAPSPWRGRLAIAGLIASLLLLAAVAMVVYQAYLRTAADLVHERDKQLAFLSAARLRDELDKFAGVLQQLARDPGLYGGDPAAQLAVLRAARPELAVFDGGTVLFDRFGKVRATVPFRMSIMGDDWSDRPYFRVHLTSGVPAFSDVVMDGLGEAAVVALSVPVENERGEFVGVLAGMFRLGETEGSSLYASIVRLRLGQSGNTYLVDGRRRILYDSGFAEVGRPLGAAGSVSIPAGGEAGALRAQDATGNEIMLAYAPVPGTPWTLVTEDDWATLIRSVDRTSQALLGLIGLGVLLPAVGLVIVARQQRARNRRGAQAWWNGRWADLMRRRMLPPVVPTLPGWSLLARHRPPEGDGQGFHDFLLLPDGRLMWALARVPEDREPPASVVATLRAGLRAAAHGGLAPDAALAVANHLACPELAAEATVCCGMGLVEPGGGAMVLANAGLPPPRRFGPRGVVALAPAGPPLGLAPEADYRPLAITLAPGEGLLLYSAGLTEATNAEGLPFGGERLDAVLASATGDMEDLMDALLEAHREFTGRPVRPAWCHSLLVLARAPAGPEPPRPPGESA